MIKNGNKIIGTTTQFAEMIIQVIALGALSCTLILVIDRAAVCSFYHIEPNHACA